jgi:predicted transcriptional regulator
MKKDEPIEAYLRRRLSELKGHHNRIARETGVPQSTLSRIYLGQSSPTLATAQPVLDWLKRFDRSAGRVANAGRRIQARPASDAAASAALCE